MKTEVLLNVANICHLSKVNGPGTRSVIWVQGCRRNCPGCINPHTHSHNAVKLLDPSVLGKQLCQIQQTNGITLSGGEPFEQAKACGILAETVKNHSKTVVVFTGFPFNQIITCQNTDVQHFLNQVDLLVAGPYIQELACESRLWQASSNQTVHFLTPDLNRFLPWQDREVFEINTSGDQLMFTGFPDSQDIEWMKEIFNGHSNYTK
jgi:anaerobic ribonucleoside-triphosphate reductase activating protein